LKQQDNKQAQERNFSVIELKVNNNNNNNNNKRKNVSSDASPQQAMEAQWSAHISYEK
jgi:hypothetical protein